MKNYRKALLLVLCAVLLVAASVLGTLAYLTDTKSVTNTFTVGSVKITLDENHVDDQGKAVTPADRHDDGNTYHLLPGHEYDKDPIVHVVANSDDCYVFVKVENQIAAIEDQSNTVVAQIKANNWSELSGVDNVYYKVSNKGKHTRASKAHAKRKASVLLSALVLISILAAGTTVAFLKTTSGTVTNTFSP